jgi:hypothetical protein
MNKNARKNRPKKKEIPLELWTNQLNDLKRQFAYGDRRKEEEKVQPSSGDTEA